MKIRKQILAVAVTERILLQKSLGIAAIAGTVTYGFQLVYAMIPLQWSSFCI